MRFAVLSVALVACATPPTIATPKAPGAQTALAPQQTPVPSSLPTRDVFIVDVEGTTARCEKWRLDGEALTLSRTGELIQLSMDEKGLLNLETIERGDSSFGCSVRFTHKETRDALIVDDASWFYESAACDGAIAAHKRVAMNWQCADEPPPLAKTVVAATTTKFEGLLAKGGTLYQLTSGEEGKGHVCKPMTVRADKPKKDATGTLFEGGFQHKVVNDEGVKGVEELGYSLHAGDTQLWMTGPGVTYADGSSHAFGCLSQATVEYRADHVLLGEPAYFTQKGCRAALDVANKRMSWFPIPEGADEPYAMIETGSASGC